MTVAELIAQLQALPDQNIMVVVDGYEGGLEELTVTRQMHAHPMRRPSPGDGRYDERYENERAQSDEFPCMYLSRYAELRWADMN